MKKKKRKYPELTILKGKLREKKYSYAKMASEINISSIALCDKLNGYHAFNSGEMEKIMLSLELDIKDVAYYFFPDVLRKLS